MTMVKSHDGSGRHEPETMKTKQTSRMTVDVDISDVPSLDRIPTAREFQSFDSSIGGGEMGAQYARYTVASESSYDKYLDGAKDVGSDDDSGAGPFLGGEDDEEDIDWYADSFDHYDRRLADVTKRKSKRRLKQYKKTSLLDEDTDADLIVESRTKQSTRKRDLRIYSPPSQGGSTKDLAEMRNPSFDFEEEEQKEKESQTLQNERRMSSINEIRSVLKKEQSSTRSSRSRSRSPVAKEIHPTTGIQLSPTQATKSRSPSPVLRDPPDNTEKSDIPASPKDESQAEEPDTESKASSRRSSSVGKLFSKKFKSKPHGKKGTSDSQVIPLASKDSQTRQETIDSPPIAAEVLPRAPTMDAATNTSIASSFSQSSLSDHKRPPKSPFSKKSFTFQTSSKDEGDAKSTKDSSELRSARTSSKDEDEAESTKDSAELKSAPSVTAASTHSEVNDGTDDAAPMNERRTVNHSNENASVSSSPSQSSASRRKKPPKSPFSLKRFSFRTSSKEEAEASGKKGLPETKMGTSDDTPLDDVNEEKIDDSAELNKEKEVIKNIDNSAELNKEKEVKEKVDTSAAMDEEKKATGQNEPTGSVTEERTMESESIINITNRKAEKAVRLIRSYIRVTKEEETDTSDKDASETGTASTSKTSSESANVTNNIAKKLTVTTVSSSEKLKTGSEEKTEDVKQPAQDIMKSNKVIEPIDDKKQDAAATKDLTGQESKLQHVEPTPPEGTSKPEEESGIEKKEAKSDEKEVEDNKKEEPLKANETRKSTKSRGLFGLRKRGKSTNGNVHEIEKLPDSDKKEEGAPLEIITVPSNKMSGVAGENEAKGSKAPQNSEETDNRESQSGKPAATSMFQNLCDEDPDQSKMIEIFLRDNYCGGVADCLGYWDYSGEKESVGATNAAVNSRKIKLDSGEIDIDQAVAAMRRSKRMAPLPIKTIDIPQDYIFPSTSSVTDSQAAYKGKQARKKKSSEAKEEDQRRVKSFLRAKMGRRPSKKKSDQPED